MELNSPLLFQTSFADGLRPDPLLTVSEWAARNRMLSSRASAEPGLWRNERTPYLTEIMDSLSALSPVEEVRFMKGAQIGATESGNNWIGYIIAGNASAPTMMVLPTVEMAKRSSKQRIQPLIDESPILSARVKPARERDSGNSTLLKEFPGGVLVMTGANSAVGLRSMAAKNIFLDEADAFPGDIDGEGCPVELARARARTFARRKIFIVSTPTIAGRSRIEQLFLEGDQRYFYVPCPHCGAFQKLEWSGIRWTDGDYKTAHYVCSSCQEPIYEQHKTAMLAHGEWRPENKNADPRVRSYHLNSLYSPVGWLSWTDAVKMWLDSKGSQDKLRAFLNTVLGETWKERGEAPEWEKLYRRREPYAIGTVPRGAIFLTCGVDVQKDRIEYEVCAWGRDKQSWSVEYGQIFGDTSNEDSSVWRELDDLLGTSFQGQGGQSFPIKILAVDTGFNTQAVYNWVRRHPQNRVIAVKGTDTATQIISLPRPVDVTSRGKQIKRGLRLWTVGVSLIKSELYSWLNLEPPLKPEDAYPAGFCHFPEYGEDYFKMITAEQLMVKYVRGFRRYEWEKLRERNEALDCRVYARAAAAIVGLDRFNPAQWDQIDPNGPSEAVQNEAAHAAADGNKNSDAPALEARTPGGRRPTPFVPRRKSSFW